jgi:hypothetical protein
MPPSNSATVIPLASIPQPGALGVAMAVNHTPTNLPARNPPVASDDRVALVIQSGCPPMESLSFVVADLTYEFGHSNPTLSNVRVQPIADNLSLSGAPSIGWVINQSYAEWRVACATSNGARHVQRVTTEGALIGRPIDSSLGSADPPLAVGVLTSGNVLVVSPSSPTTLGGAGILVLVCGR